jgi:hypothetical protein
MNQVIGYQGTLIVKDFPKPLIGPYDINIKVEHSVFSSGTESTRIRGQMKKSFLSKWSSYSAG